MSDASLPAATRRHLGLRARTLLALLLLALVVVAAAVGLGRLATDNIRDQFGAAFARNHALLNQQRVLTLIERELALARRFAASTVTRDWLMHEDDAAARARFFAEAEGYRQDFADHSWFIASALGERAYYHSKDGDTAAQRETPRYRLDPQAAKDAWFFASLKDIRPYNINVAYDSALQATKVWFNVRIADAQGRPLGIAGTGLDLQNFINNFIAQKEAGVVAMLLDGQGLILAHPNPDLIEYASVGKKDSRSTVFRLLGDAGEVRALAGIMRDLAQKREPLGMLRVSLEGQPRLLALTWIADLDIYVVTALDLGAARFLDGDLVFGLALAGLALLGVLALVVTFGIDRLILAPLSQLTESARQIAGGRYDVRLNATRQDELGELSRDFDIMAQTVREHTELLEQRVADRTHELSEAHARLAATHRQLTDSIRYASLIQTAFLPDRQLRDDFPGEHFVLWAPRDVVGGDLYLYRRFAGGHLLGVVDCAGHGVPGAFMTMIANATLDLALQEVSASDPAALLTRIDAAVRGMLPSHGERFDRIVATMDMALCWLPEARQPLVFSGAHMALYRYAAGCCERLAGHRRGIADRRPGDFRNMTVERVAGDVFYMATDGYFDQAGGACGFGMGEGAFMEWIAGHGELPLQQQEEQLIDGLAAHQGARPQLDDITVFAFRTKDDS